MGRLVKTGSGTSQNGRLIRVGESTVKPYFQTAQKRTVTALPNAGTPTADRARLGLATGGNPVSDSLTRFVEKKQTAPPPEVETPISSMNFTKGLGYGSERAGAAMLGAAENITDLIGAGFWKGVQGITSAGGLLPNPVSEYAERAGDAFLDNSVTRDWEESIRARYQPTQAEEAVTGVGQTVLQMLPGIGAAKAVSAAGNAANALNASNAARAGANAGRAVFGLQAAGGGANEARAEGAATGQALAYGAASGLLETAIESIAGGVPGLGKGKVREIAGAVISNPVVGKALDIAGEGGEEALSAVLSPYLKRAIYDSDAEHATAEEIAQSAVMGALAAGVLQAGLELPGAISNTVSQVQSTRASAPVKGALLDSLNQEARRPRAGELGPERGRAEGPEAPETSPRRRESDPTVRESERVIVTSSGKSALDGQNSLAKTLAENIENISDMAPVAALTGMEMNQRNKKPSDQIRDFFSKVGSVFRRGFGTVSFGEYGVGGILNHRPLNRAKMVSLVAVPDVIRNGRIISDVENWKGRGYRSVIFAAPATINDTPVYIAAVVNQNPDGKFYLNECVDSEGNYIRIENSSPNGTKSGVTVQDGVTATPGELFSASIIADSSAGGNTQSARNRTGVTAVGDEYLRQALDEVWQGADGPSVRGPQEDGIQSRGATPVWEAAAVPNSSAGSGQRILEEGWRDEAPSVRGPEENGVHNLERLQLLDSAENAGYDESTVWEGHRELDQDGNPVYAVTRREANIQPEDLRALQRKQRETAKRLGMDGTEASRLERYVSGMFSYEFNQRMADGDLNESEKNIARGIQSALEKFPQYDGRTYRNLGFKTEEAYDAFLAEYAEGSNVTMRAFTSTSKRPNGYPKFGGGVVHLVIDGHSGRDIADTYGLPRQQEVIYLPGTEMTVIQVTTANDGNPLIYLKEEASNGAMGKEAGGDHGAEGPTKGLY